MTVKRATFTHVTRETGRVRPLQVPEPGLGVVGLALADGLTRDLVRLRFERLGWKVLTASDGQRALHMLQTQSLALILLDLWLPQINGLDVLRQARIVAPAIILSDVASPELVLGAVAAGAQGFVLKPVDLDALVARARQAMTGRPVSWGDLDLILQIGAVRHGRV